jgi:hypothetical protein
VFQADDAKPRARRFVHWFEKQGGKLAHGGAEPVPKGAAAFDVCSFDEAKGAQLVYVMADGVVDAQTGASLAKVDTLFPHVRDDALPRVRLCFELFKGEAPALVVPTLAGVSVFRRKGAAFEPHARIAADASLRFQGQFIRGDDALRTQRVTVRLEFPDVTAPDFDGDGLADLCMTRSDRFACHLQRAGTGFAGAAAAVTRDFDLLTDAEAKDSSLRADIRLVDVTGDGRVDALLAKSTWNISTMQTTLYVHPQAGGRYSDQPAQTINRKGYFGFQEVLDYDGDGRVDLVAPVAALGWSKLARIYFSGSTDIDFVWYRNEGRKFAAEATTLHAMSYPVDLKNANAILGSLPLWGVRFVGGEAAARRQVAFFPRKKAVEVYAVGAKGELSDDPLWQQDAAVGNEVLRTDLDGDGLEEIVFAYPRDPERSKTLLMVDWKG